MNWLAPRSWPDAIERLHFDFVFCPLFQVLNGKLPLLPVWDDVGQDPSLGALTRVLHPVAHQLWIAIVFPLWQRLEYRHTSTFGIFRNISILEDLSPHNHVISLLGI